MIVLKVGHCDHGRNFVFRVWFGQSCIIRGNDSLIVKTILVNTYVDAEIKLANNNSKAVSPVSSGIKCQTEKYRSHVASSHTSLRT